MLKLATAQWKVLLLLVAVCTGFAYNKTRSFSPIYESKSAVQISNQLIIDLNNVTDVDARDTDILYTYEQKARSTAVMKAAIQESEYLQDFFNVENPSDEEALTKAAREMRPPSARLRGETLIIDLTASGSDEELVYNTAKYVALGFVKSDKNEKTKENREALKTLEETQKPEKAKAVEAAAKALFEFEKEFSISNFETRHLDLSRAVDKIKIDAKDLERVISKLDNDLQEMKDLGYALYGDREANLLIISNHFNAFRKIPSVYSNENFKTDIEKLQSLERTAKERSVALKEEHPDMKDAIKEVVLQQEGVIETIADIPATILLEKSIKNNLLAELKDDLKDLTNEQETLSENSSKYSTLKANLERAEKLYDQVVSRIDELNIVVSSVPSSIKEYEDATDPQEVNNNTNQTILMGLIAGLALSYGYLYLLNVMDQSIKSVEQAEQVLQLPVLAAIPAAEPDGLEVKNRLIMKGSSNSSCSESFRSLRVNIESMNRSKSSKVVVFTSSMPSEGKTFTSINYAASLAQQGHKTLLIDMDLRKPAVAKDFGIEMSKYVGLTEIITSDEKLEQFPEFPVYQAAEGLSVLHGGPLIDNPAERLSSYAIERIVEKAREHFDRVVIDSAPLGPVGDTLTVARLADMVCLVVRSDKTPSKVILRIIDTLHRHGHTPAGIVLNFMKVKTGYGSYYYYYSSDKQPEITSEKPPYKRKSGDVADSNIASTQLGESGGLEESEPKKNQIPPELESMLKAKQEYTRSDKSVESRPSV